MLYNNDMLQDALIRAKNDSTIFFRMIDESSICESDKDIIKGIIQECWYEEFDEYDSDICEEFLMIYEEYISSKTTKYGLIICQ